MGHGRGRGAADWIGELDFEVPVVDGSDRPGHRVPVSGSAAPAPWTTGRRRPPRPSPSSCMSPGRRSSRCSGPAEDVHRRPGPADLGNQFVFTMLAQQNVETLNDAGRQEGRRLLPALLQHHLPGVPAARREGTTRSSTTPSSSPRLVEEGRLTPVNPVDEKITYHDPCFLGRHNKVYTPPRSIIDAVPGTTAEEMHRCKGKGFCCGAGGARMWLEERTGKRINEERIDEALALDPDTVSTACPYCMVMLGDAIDAKKSRRPGQGNPRGHRRRPGAPSSAPSSCARARPRRLGLREGLGKGHQVPRPSAGYLAPRCRPHHRPPRGGQMSRLQESAALVLSDGFLLLRG